MTIQQFPAATALTPGASEPASPAKGNFLENVTLARLISPISEEEFRKEYFERKPLIISRNDSNFYDDLLTLEDFDRGIATTTSYVKTAEAKSKKNAKLGSGSSERERLLADMRGGSTLVLDQFQDREPKLGLLCRRLEQELSHRFQTNCYLTPPQGAGFTPHWDNHDVFVLQVFGSKHWKVEKQRRRLPGKSDFMAEEEGRTVREEDAFSFTLNQGDMIYIPRGVVHAAECGSQASLHITLGLMPNTWDDLLNAAVKAIVDQDERLRHTLPLGFMRGDRRALVKRLIATLRSATDENFLDAVVNQFSDELVTRFPIDLSGQVTQFFQPTEIKSEDTFGPRPGVVFRMHVDADTVRINVGGRTIAFPDFFKEALECALKQPSYLVRSLPGDLEEEEKIFFIERLMQEGLVIRK